jgi:hypothetical protein
MWREGGLVHRESRSYEEKGRFFKLPLTQFIVSRTWFNMREEEV